MTVIENLDLESDRWDAFADLGGFERIRPLRDGQMPVGSDRAKHRAYRRSNPYRRCRSRPLSGSRRA
jgi:hypothetical protein